MRALREAAFALRDVARKLEGHVAVEEAAVLLGNLETAEIQVRNLEKQIADLKQRYHAAVQTVAADKRIAVQRISK